jgi:anhydro-N-acetylmuramic acid kinase
MSGTSLDGLDIAQVSFGFSSNHNIDFQLINCKTYPLPKPIFEKLSNVFSLSAMAVFELDQELARFYAACIAQFISENNIKQTEITAIASHGQTIFHQPNKGYTTQIGCGSTLNFLTKIPVINQFRQLDVSAGGQGAPLVPLGDALLFAPFADGFLNLGGFANISTPQNASALAYDIAPANLPMNQWMQQLGKAYDANGELAREGKINEAILSKVLSLEFFSQNGPKSLGTEWLESTYLPFFEHVSIADKLRTHLEVLKTLCIRAFEYLDLKSVYVTGGGAFNNYFIELLSAEFKGKLIIPDADIINYKEAIIFAFLGARFLRNETTTLSAVTGATEALRTGILHDFQASLG